MATANAKRGAQLTPLSALPQGFIYQPKALSEQKSTALYQHLKQHLPWQQPKIKVFDKWHKIPRLQCYMGDSQTQYRYSEQWFYPEPWLPVVNAMRQRLQRHLGCAFNAVLINYYRHGLDSVGWHSDDEYNLGEHPTIASVSLGALRVLKIRHKHTKAQYNQPLENASLFIMHGQSQANYEHCVAKQTQVSQGRINLTFRYIYPS